jgi:serine/threonine protein phosphatase PrpC
VALSIDACTAQHQGDRGEQQDRVAILTHPEQKGMALAVLADGMGGHAGGALAAEQVLHTAKTSFAAFSAESESPQTMLTGCLLEAHTMIKASRFLNEKDPHSTAVMLLIQPGHLAWMHCGDSRLYRFRGKQPLSRTVDHSYVEYLVASGRITPEQALTHSHRNVLVTAIGGAEDPKLSFSETAEVLAGDAFLLCSDGLWAYFDEQELATIVAENPARQACEMLIDLARQRASGNGDNLSLAIVKLINGSKRPG